MITQIFGLLIPLVQVYLLFRIFREVRISADAVRKSEELNESIKKFGAMFAAAADVPRPPAKKKMVAFEAKDDG
jgi:hypothetical protein